MKLIITEEQVKNFKKDRWCKHIEDIVLSMNIKRLCGVQVGAIDSEGKDGLVRNYLVILQMDYYGGSEFIDKVSTQISDFLPHLELIVIKLDCDTSVKLTENTKRQKPSNVFFRRVSPSRLKNFVDEFITLEIDWHLRDKNVIPLEKLGETEFVYLVVEHVWEYLYDNQIEAKIIFTDEEILEIKGLIVSLFGDKIRNEYRKKINNKNITESKSLINKFTEIIANGNLKLAIDIVGSYEDLINIVGEDVITRKVKEKFIKDVANEYNGISIFQFTDVDPVFYNETETIYSEITFFGSNGVIVQDWEKDTNDSFGEELVEYKNLSDNIITEIFNLLIKKYEKGIKL